MTATLEERARTWVEEHPPPRGAAAGSRTPRNADEEAEWRQWTIDLHAAGLAVPHWPAKWGGEGASTAEVRALTRVLRAAGAPLPLTDVAINLVAPAIMTAGTDQQQSALLPSIASGQAIWTQLFSEPGAGSDLAALRTRADPAGDGSWVVTGQKVWNTYAHVAEWGYLLARTGSVDERHRGLSMFVVPMSTPGIKISPIREITGDADFNEVFFDDVVLGPETLLGAPGSGWSISMGTLDAERRVVGGLVLGLEAEYHRIAEVLSGIDRPGQDFVVRLGRLVAAIDALVVVTAPDAGFPDGLEAAGKVLFSELNLELAQLGVDVAAAYPDETPAGWARRWNDNYAYARGYTISGGANEVLRNVLAQRGLGLPRI